MGASKIREPKGFGKRVEPHTITLSRNGKVKSYKIRPVYFSIGLCFCFALLFSYFGATSYLIFRDDLVSASVTRQARIQHEYEDRIAALRAKLDRVTSRQLLDQKAIEGRVQELIERQTTIGQRNGRLSSLLEKAKKRGLSSISEYSIPVPRTSPIKGQDTLTTGSIDVTKPVKEANLSTFNLRGINQTDKNELRFAERLNTPKLNTAFTNELFGDVANAIGLIDKSQRSEVDSIRIAAAQKTLKISKVLKKIGFSLPDTFSSSVGGPFVPLDHSVSFEQHLVALEESLTQYDRAIAIARSLPTTEPLPGAKISSRFGQRRDPFNGKAAFHGGLDYKAKRGTPVGAAADGTVIKAGRMGGYGKIVEVKHRNGYITRYAHLSRITVKVGDLVKSGERVGKVGSTGRSTGPHLHFEIRKRGKPVNPSTFMSAAYKLRGLI